MITKRYTLNTKTLISKHTNKYAQSHTDTHKIIFHKNEKTIDKIVSEQYSKLFYCQIEF